MNQYEAISEVHALLPLLQKAQDPAGVLQKHARDKRYSAEQLRKMGHVLNTMLHVQHLEKTAGQDDRDAPLSLIDVDRLVTGYQQYEAPPLSKLASVETPVFETPPWEAHRFGSPMRKAASAVVAPEPPPAAVESEPSPYELIKQADTHRRQQEVDMADLEERLLHNGTARLSLLTKIGNAVRIQGPGVLAQLEQQLHSEHGAAQFVKQACAEVEAFCAKRNVLAWRAETITPLAGWTPDTTGVLKFASALVDSCLEGEALRQVLEAKKHELQKVAFGPPNYPPPDVNTLGRTAPRDPRQTSVPKSDPAPSPQGGGAGESGKQPQRAGGEAPKDNLSKLLSDALTQGGTIAKSTSDAIPTDDDVVNTYLGVFGSGKRDRQAAVESALRDVRESTTLQQVMLSDAAISKEDPKRVLAAYEAIRQINPAIAANPAQLTFVLREALEYNSLPMHTADALVSQRKNFAGAAKDEAEVQGKRMSTITSV